MNLFENALDLKLAFGGLHALCALIHPTHHIPSKNKVERMAYP